MANGSKFIMCKTFCSFFFWNTLQNTKMLEIHKMTSWHKNRGQTRGVSFTNRPDRSKRVGNITTGFMTSPPPIFNTGNTTFMVL